jgi:hypothetical protein
MHSEMVLLRAKDGDWEGWNLMELDEFLRQVDLDDWNGRQVLIGTVLPASRWVRLN